ncbi:hypothetical protein I3842_06G000900 [Carya illinoinensis]|uniref:Uncharacterized protein n=1 Tax=Carya illinoinensis TaxID=32201 RepID=A0A922EQ33_CARIL|nr:hypothetical protein I3842_06G000900 [Carya illinoinensis]
MSGRAEPTSLKKRKNAGIEEFSWNIQTHSDNMQTTSFGQHSTHTKHSTNHHSDSLTKHMQTTSFGQHSTHTKHSTNHHSDSLTKHMQTTSFRTCNSHSHMQDHSESSSHNTMHGQQELQSNMQHSSFQEKTHAMRSFGPCIQNMHMDRTEKCMQQQVSLGQQSRPLGSNHHSTHNFATKHMQQQTTSRPFGQQQHMHSRKKLSDHNFAAKHTTAAHNSHMHKCSKGFTRTTHIQLAHAMNTPITAIKGRRRGEFGQ